MFRPFFLYFALLSLAFADEPSQTTITPDADDLIAGSWTISVALPSPTTLEVFIETLFDKFNSITLVGPTTFTSLVRDRSADSATATGGTQDSSTTNIPSSAGSGGSATASAAGSKSTGNGPASKIQNGGSKVASSTSSFTVAAPPSVGTQNQPHYGMDPDSAMAIEYDKQYANVSYTPPAYVPVKIAPDVCALWDPNCRGNKTLAAEEFFGQSKTNSSGTMLDLLVDPCFDGQGTDASGTNCTSSLLNPASASFSSAAKSYMREPQCSKDYESIQPVSSRVFGDCCGSCYIYGPNVDVFYWPDPTADTSCLSIIGSDVVPLNAGAQTDGAGVVYWAASTNLYDIYVPTVTTALITTINGVVVKEAVANPWGASPSITTTRPVSNMHKRNYLSVHPRAFNPLYGRELGTDKNSSLSIGVTASPTASEITGSIAVSDGFTFTSPSVYVAFYSLSATDMCGPRRNRISSTMLAFAPGELSTVQGHLWGGGVQQQKTKVFNFADLPCPPYDVMYDDWYKPAPGEPYRPLIALPEKVRDLDPWWSACTDAYYFTGLDPPRTLVKQDFMVSPASPAANPDPKVTPDPVQPVPSLPAKTDAGQPTQVAGDPSENKGQVPPPQAVPPNSEGASNPSPINVIPPTPIKQADPQTGPAVDPGTNKNGDSPASPPHKDGDPQQGTDPKADNPVSNGSGSSGPGSNGSGSSGSGSNGSGSNGSGSSASGSSGSNGSGSNGSGSSGSGSSGSGSSGSKSSGSESNSSGSSGSGSNGSGANGSGSNGSGSSGSESNNSGSSGSGSNGSGSNGSGSNGSGSNGSGSSGSGSSGSGSNGSGSNGSPAAPSPASDTNPRPNQANSNAGSQPGSANVNPAAQPPTNDNTPSQSGESSVGTGIIPPGSSQTQPSSPGAPPIIKIPGALTLTEAPNDHNAYLVAGSTLLPGSPAAVISGTSYSLASSGALVVGTSTVPLATAGAVAGQIAAPGALWAGNVAFTPLPGGSAIIGSSTLSLSGPAVTSSGSILSLASGGLVVGSSTYAYATPASNPAASLTTQEVPITTALVVAGQSFIANPSGFSIDGTTISAGGPGVNLNGTPVSLDGSGNLAVGTSTVALESTSIGSIATSIATFEGSAGRSKICYWTLVAGLVASMLRWVL